MPCAVRTTSMLPLLPAPPLELPANSSSKGPSWDAKACKPPAEEKLASARLHERVRLMLP